MGTQIATRPDWDRLYQVASTQDGHFSARQAARAGYSPQLLNHYQRIGRIVRVLRGVYRLVHYPPGEHEDLAALWLWSAREAVFSHETALALHDLSDALPARVHLTLPAAWRKRRLRLPRGVVAHHADLAPGERAWHGSVPVTTPARTVLDCAEARVAPDFVKQAIEQGLARGLFTRAQVRRAIDYLGSFHPPRDPPLRQPARLQAGVGAAPARRGAAQGL